MGSPTPLRPTAAGGGGGGSSSSSYYPVVLHRRRRGLRRPRVRRCKMKLMYFLMDRDEEEQQQQRDKRMELEFEVSELETALDKEQQLGRLLQCSLLQGRVVCHCCLSALVPTTNVRSLLAELAVVEDEIFYLEKKVDDLRLRLRREQKWTDHCILQQQQQQQSWAQNQNRQQRHSVSVSRRELQLPKLPLPCPGPAGARGSDEAYLERESKASVGSASASAKGGDETTDHVVVRRSSHCHSSSSSENPNPNPNPNPNTNPNPTPPSERKTLAMSSSSPNKLSEELVRLAVTIFLKLNKTTTTTTTRDAAAEMELSGSSSSSKVNISCIGPRSLVPKVSVNGAPAAMSSPLKNQRGASSTTNGAGGAAGTDGCQRRFVEFTRASVDVSRISLCLVDIKNLRGLMQKLSAVDPSLLTNKQRLAFWINIYNFCVMHAFLQHGLPPSPEKLLALLNQASVNVGGTVLNAVTIEHIILRHSPDGKQGMMEEGQRDLLHWYGLGYPEPNVVFALCRGSRSSPALRVYTAEDVSNELERAKAEYLESSVRLAGGGTGTGRKQRAAAAAAVVVPRLLHWHMRDFADDDDASLLEWVHSQLPATARASAPLRRAIRDVLGANNVVNVNSGGRAATPAVAKMVEVEPYDAEFCYLLPVW